MTHCSVTDGENTLEVPESVLEDLKKRFIGSLHTHSRSTDFSEDSMDGYEISFVRGSGGANGTVHLAHVPSGVTLKRPYQSTDDLNTWLSGVV